MPIELEAGEVKELNVHLTPLLASLYGKVIDVNTGTPIPEVTVDVWLAENGAVNIKTALTDSGGNYLITDIPASKYTVEFSHIECEKTEIGIELLPGETRELNVEILRYYYPFVNIHGLVSDSETLSPISNVLVQILGTELSTYTSGHYYNYTIYDVPAGTYTISFTHPDYTEIQRTIKLKTKETERISVAMVPSGIERVLLRGRVMNEEGNPLAWVDVFVYPPEADRIQVKADAQGYYDVTEPLQPGEYRILAAALPPPRYEIGRQVVTLDYGENVIDFYLKLWAE